jgi:hypothetical protein
MTKTIIAFAGSALLLSACGRDPDQPVSPEALNRHLEQRVAIEEAEKERAVSQARAREQLRAEDADDRIHGVKPGNRQ